MATIRYRYRWGRYAIVTAAVVVTGLGVLRTHDTARVPVVDVIDGDTFRCSTGEGIRTVRVWGVDCPEVRQAFGNEAAAWTAYRLCGHEVEIDVKSRDQYGRTVCKVRLPDGSDLGESLVLHGMAWWSSAYAPKDAQLRRCELKAREERLGLWIDEEPEPPWKWRARH